jgi:hypothetical protein
MKASVDLFNDGQGSRRVGDYLQTSFDLFDSGAAREEIILKANAMYAEKWGNDKLTFENAYEIKP